MTEGLDIGRLRRAIIVYSTIGVFGMALLSASLGIVPLYRELRTTQEQRLRQVVKTRTRAIEQFVWRGRSVTLQITSRTRARNLLEEYNQGRLAADEVRDKTVPILRDALRLSDEVLGIVRLDRSGRKVAEVGASLSEDLWPAPPAGGQNVSDRGPVELNGSFAFLMRAGITNPHDQEVGADVVGFNFDTVAGILAGRGGLGHSGRIRLAWMGGGESKLFAADLETGRLTSEKPTDILLEALEDFRQGDIQVRRARDEEGKWLHVVGAVEDTPWWIVATMDSSELYAPVFQQLRWTSGCVGLLALAGAWGMLLLVRPLTEDMLLHSDALRRRIREATAELAKRNTLLEAANEELSKHNQRFEQELKLAQSVQQGFLPKRFPRHDHVEFEQYYLTCEILGGDLFDVFEIGDDHIGAYIADVSGHGASAALISGLLRMAVSSVRERNIAGAGLIHVDLLHPGDVLLTLNRLLRNEIPEFDFITMLYAVIDLKGRVIRLASAGHPPPIHIARDAGGIEVWEAPSGGALGITEPGEAFPTIEKPIRPRDKIVFYTDGLTEALNPSGEEFGKDRFLDVLRGAAGSPANQIIEIIGESVRAHRDAGEVSDDFCLLIAEFKDPIPAPPV